MYVLAAYVMQLRVSAHKESGQPPQRAQGIGSRRISPGDEIVWGKLRLGRSGEKEDIKKKKQKEGRKSEKGKEKKRSCAPASTAKVCNHEALAPACSGLRTHLRSQQRGLAASGALGCTCFLDG